MQVDQAMSQAQIFQTGRPDQEFQRRRISMLSSRIASHRKIQHFLSIRNLQILQNFVMSKRNPSCQLTSRTSSRTLHAPPDIQRPSKSSGKGNLAAAVLSSHTTPGSNSPFKKDSKVLPEKKPHLLDSTASLRSASLWKQAYSQLSNDKKYKDIFMKYETILMESSPVSNSETSFPKQMETTVRFQINKMKQKQ